VLRKQTFLNPKLQKLQLHLSHMKCYTYICGLTLSWSSISAEYFMYWHHIRFSGF